MSTYRDRLVAASATSWPAAGRGQVWLLGGSLLVVAGSVLPWITLSGLASISGLAGPGLATFYLGWLGLAGALVPWRRVAIAQGLLAAVAAIALPAWQVLRVAGTGLDGWQPGLGLLVVVAGGGMAARGVVRLVADR